MSSLTSRVERREIRYGTQLAGQRMALLMAGGWGWIQIRRWNVKEMRHIQTDWEHEARLIKWTSWSEWHALGTCPRLTSISTFNNSVQRLLGLITILTLLSGYNLWISCRIHHPSCWGRRHHTDNYSKQPSHCNVSWNALGLWRYFLSWQLGS